jgi:hypothetical protein
VGGHLLQTSIKSDSLPAVDHTPEQEVEADGRRTGNDILHQGFVNARLGHTTLEQLVQQAIGRSVPERSTLGLGQSRSLGVLQKSQSPDQRYESDHAKVSATRRLWSGRVDKVVERSELTVMTTSSGFFCFNCAKSFLTADQAKPRLVEHDGAAPSTTVKRDEVVRSDRESIVGGMARFPTGMIRNKLASKQKS